jgi:transcriptional regulator with XRE-family HTH domain
MEGADPVGTPERNEAARVLGAALRSHRIASGLSLRALAAHIGLSAHGTLVDYEHGRRIPPQDLLGACERVLCVPDALLSRLRLAALTDRGYDQAAALLDGWFPVQPRTDSDCALPPAAATGPPQPVADGSDPGRAGCQDAMTMHARKLAMTEYRLIGQIELRYSARQHAAWARFAGVPALDHLAGQRSVDILVEAVREPDGARTSFRHEYCFDVHWGDLLLTGRGCIYAKAVIYADAVPIAAGETDRLRLP